MNEIFMRFPCQARRRVLECPFPSLCAPVNSTSMNLFSDKRCELLSHRLGPVRAPATSSFKPILITNIQFILMLGKIFESRGSLFPKQYLKRRVFSFLEYTLTSYQDPRGRA